MLLLCCFIVSGSSFLWMARHKKTKNHTWTAHFIDKLPSSTMSFMEYHGQASLDAQSQEPLFDDLVIKKKTQPVFRFIDKAIHGRDMRDPYRFHQEPDIATLQYYQYNHHILTTLMSQTTPDPTKLRVWDEYAHQFTPLNSMKCSMSTLLVNELYQAPLKEGLASEACNLVAKDDLGTLRRPFSSVSNLHGCNLSSVEPDLHQGGLWRDWNFMVF
jgi:hypothetical protein